MSVERYKYYSKFSFRRDIIAVCAEMMDKWDLRDRVDETAISTLVASFKRKKHWGLFFIPRLPIKLIFCSSCMEGFTESRGLQHRGTSTACLMMGPEVEQKGRSLWWEKKKKRTIERHKYTFLASTDFPRQAVFIPVPIASPSAVIARSLTPVPVALADLRSSTIQITAVARANTQVISTPVARPSLSDRPQPATTNTNVRSRARRPTVEISLRLFCGFHA